MLILSPKSASFFTVAYKLKTSLFNHLNFSPVTRNKFQFHTFGRQRITRNNYMQLIIFQHFK